MQKIVNVLAIASFAVSGAVVIGGVSVYVNRNAIIDNIKSQALEAVLGGSGGLGGALGGGGSDALPVGSNDLMMVAPQAAPIAAPQANAL